MLDKNHLRKLYLEKRLELSTFEIEKKSSQIAENFLSIDEIKDKKNFSVYLPINNEVDTKFIINNLLKKNKNLNSPYFSKVDNAYYFTKFSGWQKWEKGPYQILQPANPQKIDPTTIQVAIIPGIAFDSHGTRLGYGKGVFDQLLLNSNAVKIGAAYDFQIVGEIPREEHDLVMNTVVTEKQTLSF